MATLHLDRLPTRDQGRDGDRAHVMDRGVMRLCYKHNGEWYCSFPDVRQVKKDFTEMGRIQWVAPRGIFVPVMASAYGLSEIEVMRIYDYVFSSVSLLGTDSVQNIAVNVDALSYVSALGAVLIEKDNVHDLVLSGIAMSLTETLINVIVSRGSVAITTSTGVAMIEKTSIFDIVFSSSVIDSATYNYVVNVLRTSTPGLYAVASAMIEKTSLLDLVLSSVAIGQPAVQAVMNVLRTVTAPTSAIGNVLIEQQRISDIVFLSSTSITGVTEYIVCYLQSIQPYNTALGNVSIEKISQILRAGYYDWGVSNYANMEVHENQTRWIQIHDADNNPLGNRYEVQFGSVYSDMVASTNTVVIGPLTFTPYINSFGLYSASTGGTYYLNLNVHPSISNMIDGRLTLQENQYIQINPGEIIVAAI